MSLKALIRNQIIIPMARGNFKGILTRTHKHYICSNGAEAIVFYKHDVESVQDNTVTLAKHYFIRQRLNGMIGQLVSVVVGNEITYNCLEKKGTHYQIRKNKQLVIQFTENRVASIEENWVQLKEHSL